MFTLTPSTEKTKPSKVETTTTTRLLSHLLFWLQEASLRSSLVMFASDTDGAYSCVLNKTKKPLHLSSCLTGKPGLLNSSSHRTWIAQQIPGMCSPLFFPMAPRKVRASCAYLEAEQTRVHSVLRGDLVASSVSKSVISERGSPSAEAQEQGQNVPPGRQNTRAKTRAMVLRKKCYAFSGHGLPTVEPHA